MSIRKVTVYQVGEKTFPTLNVAIDYAETLVYDFLRKPFMQNGNYHPRLMVDLMDYVLSNREELRELLNFSSNPRQFSEDGED